MQNANPADPRVDSVLAVVRSPTGRSHPKLREAIHTDFLDYSSLTAPNRAQGGKRAGNG